MEDEVMCAVVDEIAEVKDLPELKALWCFGQSEGNLYGDAGCVSHFKMAVKRLRREEPVEKSLIERVRELELELERLRSGSEKARVDQPVHRAGRRYRLLKEDVGWSTKPQVHALMAIIKAHAKVGDVLDEADIVRMVEANRAVLDTVQTGKRIWDYYKGDHNEGLTAHGNVEKI